MRAQARVLHVDYAVLDRPFCQYLLKIKVATHCVACGSLVAAGQQKNYLEIAESTRWCPAC
jgi:hypothetical protein